MVSLRTIAGCGSKNRYQNGTLVSGNMDQNLPTPSRLILSHTQLPCGYVPVLGSLFYSSLATSHAFYRSARFRRRTQLRRQRQASKSKSKGAAQLFPAKRWDCMQQILLFCLLQRLGRGSKLSSRGDAGFGLWFHLPSYHFGYHFSEPLPLAGSKIPKARGFSPAFGLTTFCSAALSFPRF